MHPDLEPLAKEYAEKERIFHESWRKLEASSESFMRADPTLVSYYQISKEHSRVFQDWVNARKSLEAAARALHLKAADLANLPDDHPLRLRLQ